MKETRIETSMSTTLQATTLRGTVMDASSTHDGHGKDMLLRASALGHSLPQS